LHYRYWTDTGTGDSARAQFQTARMQTQRAVLFWAAFFDYQIDLSGEQAWQIN